MFLEDLLFIKWQSRGIAELARRINQLPQNLDKKLKHDTASAKEIILLQNFWILFYEQRFILNDGTIIIYGN